MSVSMHAPFAALRAQALLFLGVGMELKRHIHDNFVHK